MRNAKQEFLCKNLESFSGENYNIEKKILDFQFEPVCAKLAQITVLEATKMKKKFSTTDEVHKNGATVEKCEKMPTSKECVCCHEISPVKAVHLKFKAGLSWNTATLELFAVEFNCVENCLLKNYEFFSEIS